jgi:hypothetical protein
MGTKQKIPLVFCIDVEPEERKLLEAPTEWLGFEKSFEFFGAVRSRLAQATGSPVHFSWFLRMDPQIAQTYGTADWVVTRYPHLFKQLEDAGDEIGLHTHAWRWDEQHRDWFVDLGNPEWIEHCIRSAFDAYHNSLNRKCKSFRFGDHWMSEQGLDLLEELGVEFDLTFEPGQAQPTLLPGERYTGSFPDCRFMPQLPYRPHPKKFAKRSLIRKRNLWLLPVSAERPMTNGNHIGYVRDHRKEPFVTLNLAFNRSVFASIVDRLLSRLETLFLVIVARTDVAVAPDQRVNLHENIEYLLSHSLVDRFSCETPAEAIEHLRFRPLKWLRETLS